MDKTYEPYCNDDQELIDIIDAPKLIRQTNHPDDVTNQHIGNSSPLYASQLKPEYYGKFVQGDLHYSGEHRPLLASEAEEREEGECSPTSPNYFPEREPTHCTSPLFTPISRPQLPDTMSFRLATLTAQNNELFAHLEYILATGDIGKWKNIRQHFHTKNRGDILLDSLDRDITEGTWHGQQLR